ncbi:phosphotransferase [Saccharopolyspora erythraea]|uniref:phosphotransferase n=1 Tax=Saccharopolyspora erythraea TaxID=1836 RepID=UPI001B80D53F|nr:phosphotransferase [Saccharopolyspora erythraea]
MTTPGTAVLDLRRDSYTHAVERVEQALRVKLQQDSFVVKRRTVGARSDRGTWVRIEVQPADVFGTRGWGGIASSVQLLGVSRPSWLCSFDWFEGRFRWRADETELISARPVSERACVDAVPVLPKAWWETFNRSLDALRWHFPDHSATRHTALLTQRRITRLITSMFGEVDTVVPEWCAVHGDLSWANLTAPECVFLDWEDWGRGPVGFDAASLWALSLPVPELADRITIERASDLATRSGRISWLYQCAGLLDTETDPVFTEPARRQAARLLAEW